MRLLRKILARTRLRAAGRRLARDPSRANYLALARQHVLAGEPTQVLRICMEALQSHPEDVDLKRLASRADTILCEERLGILQAELLVAPRAAVWRDVCGLLLSTGRLRRAEETASQWRERTGDAEACFFLALCFAERFYTDLRAEDGRRAFDLAREAQRDLVNDTRPHDLQFEIARRCGCWREARSAAARALELKPGAPELEARFRSALAAGEGGMTLDEALREVERSGRLVCANEPQLTEPQHSSVRSALREIAGAHSVRAAVFLKGGTGLVHGVQGAGADRLARASREFLKCSRNASRRMALGVPLEFSFQGEAGAFRMFTGERGSAAVWTEQELEQKTTADLDRLAGAPGGHS